MKNAAIMYLITIITMVIAFYNNEYYTDFIPIIFFVTGTVYMFAKRNQMFYSLVIIMVIGAILMYYYTRARLLSAPFVIVIIIAVVYKIVEKDRALNSSDKQKR